MELLASLKRVVGTFSEDPIGLGKLMRDMQEVDPPRFSSAALSILPGLAPGDPGGDYLVTLLLASGFLPDALSDPEMLHLDEAVVVAKAACRVDPEIPVRLAQTLGKSDSGGGADDGRLLAILEAISSSRGVLLPMISRLARHSDARVQSKVALMVGRGNRNPHWVEEQLAHPDGRVRANAVEALWDIDTEEARALFRRAAGDSHNRVVGNALLGLHRLGEPEAIPLIVEMGAHESDAFRATAAWVAGESEDPRFLALLTDMMLAGKGRVRQNAIRALTRIKLKIARTKAAGTLRVHLTSFRLLADGSRCAGLAVVNGKGHPLKPVQATQVVPWENSQLVGVYRIEPRPRAETLAVAFGIPRSSGASEWIQAVERGLLAGLDLKRKPDSWAVVKYAPGMDLQADLDPVRPVSDRAMLENTIRRADRNAASPSGVLDALSLMLRSILPARGSRHLIFIADSGVGTGALTMDAYRAQMERIPREARLADATLHAILPQHVPGLVEDALRKICRETNGLCLRVNRPDEFADALNRAYFSCMDRYHLIWQAPGGTETAFAEPEIRVQVYREEGCGEDCFPPSGRIAPAAG